MILCFPVFEAISVSLPVSLFDDPNRVVMKTTKTALEFVSEMTADG